MVKKRNDMLALGVIFVLAGVIMADVEKENDHMRSRRQVTYMKKLNDSNEDETDSQNDFLVPVTKRPLPFQLVYPGDLSRFFNVGDNETPDPLPEKRASNTTEKSLSAGETILKRKKRGGYILEKEETVHSLREPGYESESLLSVQSIRSEFVQPGEKLSNGMPSEISFNGAGFLRSDDDAPGFELTSSQFTDTRTQPLNSDPGGKGYHKSLGNSQAVKDFNAAFNPSIPRRFNPLSYAYDEEQNYAEQKPIKPKPKEKIVPTSSDMIRLVESLRNDNAMKKYPRHIVPKGRTVVKVIRRKKAPVGARSPVLLNIPQRLLNHSPISLPHQTEESFINYNRFLPFHVAPKFPLSVHFLPYPHHQMLPRKVFRRKRSTSRYEDPSVGPLKISKDSDFEATSQESRKNYRVENRKDQQRADTGFIPITGPYDGGLVHHLSLPYYGSPPPPSYGSPNPVHVIHTYSSPPPPPPGPQSRHYGSSGPVEHYFHPSEARRYSYGVLGSGNFEVIRGGIFPGNEHGGGGYHGGGGGGYHSPRAPYGGDNYNNNNYGTAEIIFDGPIQGFQGFDNFPAHLINALSKRTQVRVHVPPERRQEESQLIPVSYPLQAVS